LSETLRREPNTIGFSDKGGVNKGMAALRDAKLPLAIDENVVSTKSMPTRGPHMRRRKPRVKKEDAVLIAI